MDYSYRITLKRIVKSNKKNCILFCVHMILPVQKMEYSKFKKKIKENKFFDNSFDNNLLDNSLLDNIILIYFFNITHLLNYKYLLTFQ